ncbi:MAG: hypothetical protein IJS28_04650 [Synergistaceae bacterium]|nr:hypothetical protein [Synergistaceae bacterium]
MPRIKPLPAIYGNITFRSRLEARWAIFFDRCGIKWEYRPVTFKLKVFKRQPEKDYTPDFLLHDLVGRVEGDLFVEVLGKLTPYNHYCIKAFTKPDREGYPERKLLVLNDIFSEHEEEPDFWYVTLDGDTYFDRAAYEGFKEKEYFQHETLDGDNWPALLGVNKDGQAEIFGTDGDRDYRYCADVEKVEAAYTAARDAEFTEEGLYISP